MKKKTERNYTMEKKKDVTKNTEKDGTGGDTGIRRGMTLANQKVGGVEWGLKVEKEETKNEKEDGTENGKRRNGAIKWKRRRTDGLKIEKKMEQEDTLESGAARY
jgi:hypothetical protein